MNGGEFFVRLHVIALVASSLGCTTSTPSVAPMPQPSGGASAPMVLPSQTIAPTLANSIAAPTSPTPEPSASVSAPEPDSKRVTICSDCDVGSIVQYVHFDQKKSKILPSSVVILEEAQRVLQEHPTVRIEIRGHIDPSEQENLQRTYGYHRAEAVRKWFIQHGIDANRLVVKDYGDSMPLIIAKSIEDRARNRRVDFRAIHEPQSSAEQH